MKKILKNKKTGIIGGVVLLILAGGVGYYFYRNNLNKKEADNTTTTQEAGKSNEDKGDNVPDTTSSEKDYQTVGGETPTVAPTVGVLNEVSLTVYLVTEDTTSQDGKTVIAAGSTTPYFYLPSGIYSVQKLTGGVWKDVATNIQYPGHGGLAAGYTTATEDNISYRVLKIENNAVKSISKTFVVKRSDLASGSKTYN